MKRNSAHIQGTDVPLEEPSSSIKKRQKMGALMGLCEQIAAQLATQRVLFREYVLRLLKDAENLSQYLATTGALPIL